MSQLPESQPVSLTEFEQMKKQDGLTYELIDGVVMMSPRPAARHQLISLRLSATLYGILTGKPCTPIQELDLVLEGQNFVPDLMIVCDEGLEDMAHYEKPPVIVVEIVSPSSGSRDYFVKRQKYEELGIQEYWIVSPEEKCIMVIAFGSGQQARYCDGQAKSFVMPEILFDLKQVFT